MPSEITLTHPRRHLFALLGALIVLLVLGTGVPARAAPTPQQIEQQINAAWNKLEPLIEQYNQVHAQLQANQAKEAALQKQIGPLQLQVDLAMTRVGLTSAQLYKYGPAFHVSSMLAAGNPTDLLGQLSDLNEIARTQNTQVATVAAQRDRYLAAKRPYDQLVARLAVQQADLDAKKNSIQAQLDKLQQLRLAAYGSGGGATGNLRPKPCPLQYFGDAGSIAARKACSLIGKPYIWADAGPDGYDCSGLSLAAWAAVGVTLPHYTKSQWADYPAVSRSQLRPGDLVFYYSDVHHMGIYVGGGWIVHAPHTGDYVRMAEMTAVGPIQGYRRPH